MRDSVVESIRATLCCALVAQVVGCGASGESIEDASAEDAAFFMRTKVHLAPDGSPGMTTERISRATQLREIAAREAFVAGLSEANSSAVASRSLPLDVLPDSGCSFVSIWLFDREGLTGNEICFFGDGTGAGATFLQQYPRWICTKSGCFLSSWSNAVRSLWAGVDPGMLDYFTPANTPGTVCDSAFASVQREDTLSLRAQNSSALVLGVTCQ